MSADREHHLRISRFLESVWELYAKGYTVDDRAEEPEGSFEGVQAAEPVHAADGPGPRHGGVPPQMEGGAESPAGGARGGRGDGMSNQSHGNQNPKYGTATEEREGCQAGPGLRG